MNLVKHRSSTSFYKSSAVLGGLFFILHGVIFSYSHGTTPQNRQLSVLGLEQSVALTIVSLLSCLLLWIGLIGLEIHVKKAGKTGKFLFRITQTTMLTLILSALMQNVFVDPRTEWDSTIAIAGWLLQLLSWGVFSIGMMSLGILFYKKGHSIILSFLTFVIGLIAVLTIQAEMMIYNLSTGTVIWDILHAGLYVPFGISWIFLTIQFPKNDTASHVHNS